MVGIVIVAHSQALAEAVLAMARQMLRQNVPMAVAGGIDDPEHPFGTDATAIRQAIESVYSPDGVVVLMDMGSAILSAETALEFLTPEQRERVRLCEAPIVEGAIAAAVRAEADGTLEEVLEEARGALAPKIAQLQAEVPEIAVKTPSQAIAQAREVRLVVRNRLGIHARPAARFVTTAARYQSEITVTNISRDTGAVSAKSINRIATLGVRQGHEIIISAAGPDAEPALDALKSLVESNLGETENDTRDLGRQPMIEKTIAGQGVFHGIPVAPGIAIGPAVFYRPRVSGVTAPQADSPEIEWQHLESALNAVRQDIQALRTNVLLKAGDYPAAIFDAHLLILADPVLTGGARRGIHEARESAASAWQTAIDEMIKAYNDLEDPYQRARAADLADLKTQVLERLSGKTPLSFKLNRPGILIASDLTPSDIARLETDKVSGIATALGTATSHAAILARALSIPAIVGLGPEVLRIAEGTQLVLNGDAGEVLVDPPDLQPYQQRRQAWRRSQETMLEASQKPAVTADGHEVKVLTNIGSLAEVGPALKYGADGIGLLRTEFLFMGRDSAPSEEEQFAVYKSIAEQLGERPLTIRTLDIGGDKPVPYLDLPAEPNPFLGYRGIRFTLDRPDLFKTQLRAILRASYGHQFSVMFPMIASLPEVRRASDTLTELCCELRRAGVPFDESMKVGVMIEVPAVIAIAYRVAKEVDFFSIGTNDLSQYIMAADRTNARVASLSDPLHPQVLRMVWQTIKAGHAAGKKVGLCGEIAANRLALPVLLGLGVDELSMNAPAIPAIKQAIACIDMADAACVADAALNLDSAEDVRQYLKEKVKG